jgi:hypothetical protein
MTFELSPNHLALRDRARAFAHTIAPRAAELDGGASLSDAALQEAERLVDAATDQVSVVVAAEEVASASGAVAIRLFARGRTAVPTLSGLRGVDAVESGPRGQLVLAAVGVGLGRAAVARALEDLRAAQAAAGKSVEKPHWAVADAATEVEAARLLTYRAASVATPAPADIALARLSAMTAAHKAIDTALRIAGPDGFRDGADLERLARDVRALSMLAGSEEELREAIALELLPSAPRT